MKSPGQGSDNLMHAFREPRKFKQIVVYETREIFQVDIADIHSLVDKGMPLARYFIVCIDVYSIDYKAVVISDRKELRGTLNSLFCRKGNT
ncbi:MAG: hypothetical protein QXQ02_10050 [Halobacteria archaeon]